ncbi:hypothetical protein RUND412_007806, partial [Rhizina undulata]
PRHLIERSAFRATTAVLLLLEPPTLKDTDSLNYLSNSNNNNMTHQSTDYNTLATTWACSMLSLIIIITRLSWRYRQVGRMYLDDLWMGISLGPLLLRLAFIHVTLVWMTNNFDRSEYPVSQMSPLEIKQRIIGSKLVLPGRVFYAAL